jgi:hypothetical protein
VDIPIALPVPHVGKVREISPVAIKTSSSLEARRLGRNRLIYQALCQGRGCAIEPPNGIDGESEWLRAIRGQRQKGLVDIPLALGIVVVRLKSAGDWVSVLLGILVPDIGNVLVNGIELGTAGG